MSWSYESGCLADQLVLLSWRSLLYSVLDRITELTAMSAEPVATNPPSQ